MSKEKILVVDDEKAILALFEAALSRHGYEVHTTESGIDALEILKRTDIQLIFLDLNMPEMDGVELCREIRKNMPIAIVVAITGYPSLFELTDCRDAGFDDYYKKPINLSTLTQITTDAFEKLERWKKT